MFLLVYVLILSVIVVGLLGAAVAALVIGAIVKSANSRRAQSGLKPLSEVKAADVIEAIGSSHPQEPILQAIKRDLPPWFGKLVKGTLAGIVLCGLGWFAWFAFNDYIESKERLARIGTTYVTVADADGLQFYHWAKVPAFERTATYEDAYTPGNTSFPEGVCVQLIPVTMNGEAVSLVIVQGEYIYDLVSEPDLYLAFIGRNEFFRKKTDDDVCAPRIAAPQPFPEPKRSPRHR